MKNETLLKIFLLTVIVGVGALIVGVVKMKDNVTFSNKANVNFDAYTGVNSNGLGDNTEEPRFQIIQSYTYNLNGGGAVVRVAVLRDKHNGDEYMFIRDPESGLVVTKLSSTGH
jgi:hypothetical protein